MKIRRMNATFGKLVRKSLELGGGLNVIYGGNESGKSTWCAFIRAMLYGINTREQTKAGFIADKERFLPWSGESMHGSMEVEWQGKQLRIERTGNRGGVLSSPIVTDLSTGLFADADVPGESMLGIKREVFERTAFIAQTALKVENDRGGELEKRIVSAVGSGDEAVSHAVASDRLKGWRNRRRYQNRGEIPELVRHIDDLRAVINSLYGDVRSLTANRIRIEELTAELERLQGQAEIWKNLRAWERATMDRDAGEELAAARAEYARTVEAAHFGDFLPDQDFLENLAKMYQRYVDDEKNYTISIENMRKAEQLLAVEKENLARFGALAEEEKVDSLEHQSFAEALEADLAKRPRIFLSTALTALICGAVSFMAAVAARYAAANISALPQIPSWAAIAAAGAAALISGGVTARVKSVRTKREKEELKRRLGELLELYGAENSSEIPERAEKCTQQKYAVEKSTAAANAVENNMVRMEIIRADSREKLCALLEMLSRGSSEQDAPRLIDEVRARIAKMRAASAQLETARVRYDTVKAGHNLDAFLQDAACPQGTEKPELGEDEINERIAALNKEIHALELDCSARQARIGSVGNPGDLQEQLREAREALAKKEREHEAIECAMDALAKANGEMQRRFAPTIEKAAGEIFARLTDGRFEIVEIQNAQLEVLVREEHAAAPRRVAELSQGTADELYLAVRLALSIALSEKEDVPIVLDDALVNFDDARMTRALECLQELAQGRQIILFTCHSREAEWAKNHPSVQVQSL